MSLQLPICIPTCERPVDAAAGGVAAPLPGGHFARQDRRLGGTAGQALTLQHADLDLGHVQPAGVRGSVMELDSAQQDRRAFRAMTDRIPD